MSETVKVLLKAEGTSKEIDYSLADKSLKTLIAAVEKAKAESNSLLTELVDAHGKSGGPAVSEEVTADDEASEDDEDGDAHQEPCEKKAKQ